MHNIVIPDDLIRNAFAEALAMPPDTDSTFFSDLRKCLGKALFAALAANGVPVVDDKPVELNSKRDIVVHDIAPIQHFSKRYRTRHVLDSRFCLGYEFEDYSLPSLNYIYGADRRPPHRASLLPFRKLRNFSVGSFAFRTETITEASFDLSGAFRLSGIAHPNGSNPRRTPFLALLGVYFDYRRIRRIVREVSASIPRGRLLLQEIAESLSPVMWIDRRTGRFYTCRCFDGTYEPHKSRPDLAMLDNLCCLCNKRTPRFDRGSSNYYTPFQQLWKPYLKIFENRVEKEHLERYAFIGNYKSIEKDAEIALRDYLGMPMAREKWPAESELFRIVTSLFDYAQVLHHYRGPELFGQEHYLYIPHLRLAIEYHGAEHFQSLQGWGGEEGLAKRMTGDAVKRKLAERHAVSQLEFTHHDSIDPETVRAQLLPFITLAESGAFLTERRYADADEMLEVDAKRYKARKRQRSSAPPAWKPLFKEGRQVEEILALRDRAMLRIHAGEAFHVLAICQKDGSTIAEEFLRESLARSLGEAQRRIADDAALRFYALAFPYSIQDPDDLEPHEGILLAMERIDLMSSLFVFCEFRRSPSGALEVETPVGCYRTDVPLLDFNRRQNAEEMCKLFRCEPNDS